VVEPAFANGWQSTQPGSPRSPPGEARTLSRRPQICSTLGRRRPSRTRQSLDRNAFAERFVLSIKSEFLDKLIPLGERHLRAAVTEFVEHCHSERTIRGSGPVDHVRGRARDAVQREGADPMPRASRWRLELLLPPHCVDRELAPDAVRIILLATPWLLDHATRQHRSDSSSWIAAARSQGPSRGRRG
jgi:hypothetical protein